jgi:lipopolysaccharide export system protein LptC
VESADNLYSRFVFWAKLILPLAALALLSTLFLFSTGRGTDSDLPYADIEAIARETRLTEPNFAGVTEDGTSYSVAADMARPAEAGSDILIIDDIRANLTSADGLSVRIDASKGELNATTRVAELKELARLSTSNGYEMETSGLWADFATGAVRTTGPLEVHAPYGTLTAGRLELVPGHDGIGTQMVFKDGVRLVYQPEH